MSRVLYIINPAGHGGAGIKAWGEFQRLWPKQIDPSDIIISKRIGHAREIASCAKGHKILAAVGGDGTVGDVMSGIMEREGQKPKLAIIPAGTGNDIARHASINSIEDAACALQEGDLRNFDIMRVDYQDNGQPAYRYAFLIGAVGFSAQPMIKPWMKRFLGPKGAYYLGTFLQIILHKSPYITLLADGEERTKGHSWMVMVANVEYTSGGSMCVAPGASTEDGELNITVYPANSKFTMITKLFPKVPSGDQIKEPGVTYFLAKKIELNSDPPAILDLDGDVFGTTPARFAVCPGMLQIMTPVRKDNKSV